MIDPTPKKPSTVFMMDVCSFVDEHDIADERKRRGFEDADAGARKRHQRAEIPERIAGDEQIRRGGEQGKSGDDGGLAADAVGEMAEQEASQRDAAHGRVLKRSRGRQTEMESFDDFGNDDADRIGGHGEHHEHDERQGL